MHSLIIHMATSTERRANVDRLLDDLPDARVIDAIDGRTPEIQATIETRNGDMFAPAYPFSPLLGGEIGCFLSHQASWQAIVDNNWPAALIAEDDLEIAPDALAPLLALLGRHEDPDVFIRIPPKDREPLTMVDDQEGDLKLFTPALIGLQTTFQLVGLETAKRLLAATKVLDRPVDTFLQMHWITGQKIQTILPNGCTEKTFPGSGSTVQSKTTGVFHKISREITRARYRGALKRHPQT
nr:glycosyltransferase family 25 protein [uncultured Shimia sp.]